MVEVGEHEKHNTHIFLVINQTFLSCRLWEHVGTCLHLNVKTHVGNINVQPIHCVSQKGSLIVDQPTQIPSYIMIGRPGLQIQRLMQIATFLHQQVRSIMAFTQMLSRIISRLQVYCSKRSISIACGSVC